MITFIAGVATGIALMYFYDKTIRGWIDSNKDKFDV